MEEEAQLVHKFTTFFHEVLPLFQISDKQQADVDLADARNIHTFLYFLKNNQQKALIVNWRSLDEGKSRFYFHLNAREVGDVNKGFTLIKKLEFDIERKFKYMFHAFGLEPLLVTRIDVLLFEELITSMHPDGGKTEEPKKASSGENSHVLTFGQEQSILPLQEDGYISITEEANGLPVKSKPKPSGLRASKTGSLSHHYSSNPKGITVDVPGKNLTDGSMSGELNGKPKRPVEFQPKENGSSKAVPSPRASINISPAKLPNPSNRPATPRRVEELRRSQIKKDSEGVRSPSPSRGIGSRSASTRKLVEASDDVVAKINHFKSAKAKKELDTIASKSNSKKTPADLDSSGLVSSPSKEGLLGEGAAIKSKKKKVFYVQESLEDARNQLKQTKVLIPEICTYHHPEPSLLLAMQAIMYLMTGKKLPWVKIKLELKKPTWLKEFLELEPSEAHLELVEDIIKEGLASDDWDSSKPGSSQAKQSKAKPFAEWVETFCAEVKKLHHPGKEEYLSQLSHQSGGGLSSK